MTHDPTRDAHPASSERPFFMMVGEGPLLISAPHNGAELPAEIAVKMTARATQSEDTDWFMRELYEPIARSLNATLLCARFSRYVVDLNRPASDESLYPGQRTTSLCPAETFSGEPLYPSVDALTAQDKQARVETYWKPYHQALSEHLARLKALHGHVLLWEAHSIKSVVPLLFEGRLPDFNLGSFEGRSCHPAVERSLNHIWSTLQPTVPWSFVLNGRFKGGHITRAYGDPSQGIHAVQLELSQRVYLGDEEAPAWSEETQKRADLARESILPLIKGCLEVVTSLGGGELE